MLNYDTLTLPFVRLSRLSRRGCVVASAHRFVLFTLMLAGAFSATVARAKGEEEAEDQPERRPNILWLIGENMGSDLGCYGAMVIQSSKLNGGFGCHRRNQHRGQYKTQNRNRLGNGYRGERILRLILTHGDFSEFVIAHDLGEVFTEKALIDAVVDLNADVVISHSRIYSH